MKADIVTIFPDFFRGPLDYGITRRAQELGLARIQVHDLRAFAHDRHRTVDDRPFGGGEGMVLKPEPLFEAVESLLERPARQAPDTGGKDLPENGPQNTEGATTVVLLSASGKLFRQPVAER